MTFEDDVNKMLNAYFSVRQTYCMVCKNHTFSDRKQYPTTLKHTNGYVFGIVKY